MKMGLKEVFKAPAVAIMSKKTATPTKVLTKSKMKIAGKLLRKKGQGIDC